MNRQQRRAHERAVKRVMSNPAKVSRIKRQMQAEKDAQPIDRDQVTDLAVYAHAAMTALTQGTATEADLHSLAAIANISLLLAEQGIGDDHTGAIKAGMSAVVALFDRHARTGRIGASGSDLTALNGLIEIHEAQLELQPTQGEMMQAIREIKRRQTQGNVLEVATC